MRKKHILYQLLHFPTLIVGGISAGLGLIVLFGWYTHNITLIQVIPTFVPMQYNTALGFLFCGLGVLTQLLGRKRLAVVCGATVGAIGFLTLLQYISSLNFGIDQLLMKHYITVETSHPGRMAPNTALCFGLSGLALLIMNKFNKFRQRNLTVGIVGSIIAALGMVAFFGYLSDVNTAYGWGNLTRMAVHTAVGFALLGIGIFLIVWREEVIENTIILPQWFAFPVGINIATFSVALWQALTVQQGTEKSAFPYVILISGLLMTALLIFTIRLAQISWHRAKDIEQINQELVREITERKRAEEKIKKYSENLEYMIKERTQELNQVLLDTEEARDRIDGIIKSVADGLMVIDTQNKVILMNRAAEDMLGIRFSDAIGRSVDFLIKEKTLREKIQYTLNKKTTGYQFDFESPKDGKKHPRIMRASTSVIHDKENNKTGVVMTIRDITLEKEIDRMKTEFLSTAAHELRTPLTSIQGFSEILLTNDDIAEDERKKFLSYINKQSVGLAGIINDLLDISRIESKRGFTLTKIKCDIGDIINQVIPIFKEQSKKHKFKALLPEMPIILFVDPEKTRQVLKNLLDNAVKYSPKGGLIKVSGEVVDNYFRISVEDDGIGMTSEQVDKAFDKFYRVSSSDKAPSGTGLGMTIVKSIIEMHGGKVWVESEHGKGMAVHFTIPYSSKKLLRKKRSNKIKKKPN